MKNYSLFILALASIVGAQAKSLLVSTSNANYSFTSTTMGDALVEDASNIIIRGKAFPVNQIMSMAVVDTEVPDNQVSVVYNEQAAIVTIAGNLAKYVESSIDGAHVTITQSSEVSDATCGEITYALEGASAEGSFTLSGSYKSTINLCGIDLTNPNGAAIDIQNGKRIELSVKNGFNNRLCDGINGEQKAALYCKGHLEIKGKGVLEIAGKKGHAIAAKEYITFKNCTLNITEAIKDGINCSQYFVMESGEITINNVGDDGIQVDFKDTTDREAEDTGSIEIKDGTITAVVTNRASKTLKAEGHLYVSGGKLDLKVTGGGLWDEEKSKTKASSCLNSDEDINISGGDLTLVATGSGGKGISCDGTALISGGTISIATFGGVFAYVNNKAYDDYTGNTDNLNSSKKSSAKGIKADTFIQIDGGDISVTTAGKNAEGIESKGELTINEGTIYVNAYDDAINSSSHMNINGGDICVLATNNDGLDANKNLYINGGYIRAFGASAPECGIDANEEAGYHVFFTGGTLLAVGGGNSTPTSAASTQPYVKANESAKADTTIKLLNDSEVLAEFAIPSEYSTGNGGGAGGGWGAPGGGGPGGGGPGGGGNAPILISCGGLISGSSYTLENGSSTTQVTAVTK